jgi:hypothetical protein
LPPFDRCAGLTPSAAHLAQTTGVVSIGMTDRANVGIMTVHLKKKERSPVAQHLMSFVALWKVRASS